MVPEKVTIFIKTLLVYHCVIYYSSAKGGNLRVLPFHLIDFSPHTSLIPHHPFHPGAALMPSFFPSFQAARVWRWFHDQGDAMTFRVI
jgi:hypothetical protein